MLDYFCGGLSTLFSTKWESLATEMQGIFFKEKGSLKSEPSTIFPSNQSKWENPPLNWVKINSDASVVGINCSAAIGGVARDSSGRWLWGFSGRIGNSEVDGAELSAVKKSLEFAWERRTQRIIIETDSSNVFKWLNSGVGNCCKKNCRNEIKEESIPG